MSGSDPRLPVWHHGVCVADGLYETFRTWAGMPPDRVLSGERFQAHLARLESGCRFFHLEVPSAVAAACREVIAANGLEGRDARVRIVVWRRGAAPAPGVPDAAHVACYALGVDQSALDQRRSRGLRVLTLPPSRVPGDRFHTHKHLNSLPALLARLRCACEGFDDALSLNARGEICEAVWSNLFVLGADGVTLRTSPVDSPCLPGMTRRSILRLAPDMDLTPREEPVTREDLLAAREVFLTSSVSGIMPVIAVDGQPIGGGTPGPVAARLQDAWRRAICRGEVGDVD